MQVTVRDLMTSHPVTIGQDATLAEATAAILGNAVNELYVVADDGRLLGTVSDYELLKSSIMRTETSQSVLCVMGRNMLVLTPDMSLDTVAGLFRQSCYSQVPVVEDRQVVGQLSRRDVLRAIVVLDDLNADEETAAHRIEAATNTVPPKPAHLKQTESRLSLAAGSVASR